MPCGSGALLAVGFETHSLLHFQELQFAKFAFVKI